jgi:hypothetical protein
MYFLMCCGIIFYQINVPKAELREAKCRQEKSDVEKERLKKHLKDARRKVLW